MVHSIVLWNKCQTLSLFPCMWYTFLSTKEMNFGLLAAEYWKKKKKRKSKHKHFIALCIYWMKIIEKNKNKISDLLLYFLRMTKTKLFNAFHLNFFFLSLNFNLVNVCQSVHTQTHRTLCTHSLCEPHLIDLNRKK